MTDKPQGDGRSVRKEPDPGVLAHDALTKAKVWWVSSGSVIKAFTERRHARAVPGFLELDVQSVFRTFYGQRRGGFVFNVSPYMAVFLGFNVCATDPPPGYPWRAAEPFHIKTFGGVDAAWKFAARWVTEQPTKKPAQRSAASDCVTQSVVGTAPSTLPHRHIDCIA